MKSKDIFLHILKIISFVNTIYSIFNRGYATRGNIASCVHSVLYTSILLSKQGNILYLILGHDFKDICCDDTGFLFEINDLCHEDLHQ
jgi:hypothetical protein